MTETSKLEAQLAALARVIASERAAGRDVAPLAGTEHLLGARLALAERDYPRAARLFEASVAEYRDAGLHRERAEGAIEAARALRGAGEGARALDFAEAALAGATQVWRERDAGLRFDVPELLVRAAELAVTLAFEHGTTERFYDVIQHAKAPWLGELLSASEAPLDPALLEVEPPSADPGGQRWRLEHALASLDAAWAAYYSSAVDDARPDAEALVARAYAAVEEPRRALRPATPKLAALAELRAKLQAGEAILDLFAAHGAIYAVLVLRDRVERARVPLSLAALRERALGAYVAVTETAGRLALERKLTGAAAPTIRRTLGTMARILYPAPPDFPRRAHEMMLGPFADALAHVRRLIVAPHGPLHLVPFHALEDESGAPLARSIAVSYAPSASAWARSRRPARPFEGARRGGTKLFGVERRFSSRRSHAMARALGAEELEPPPSALEEETVAAAKRYGVEPLLGAQVQKSAVLHALGQASEVHLACLAALGQESAVAGGLVLADGILSVAEILTSERLRSPKLELVALGTGQSTAAHPSPNERATGVAYALAARLGAPVLLELWPTDLEAKERLLVRLRERRLAGESVADALRGAQADVREASSAPRPDGSVVSFAEPYYWAGFYLLEA